MGTKPLEGIRVIEFATMIAAPSCGRLLAHLGAEVIKVEAIEGAPYRKFGYMTGNEPVMFDMLNMQKKSFSVNAKHPEGKESLLKLVSTADVFLTNIREKSLERLGCTYDALEKINPRLIYAHFSGYGPTGPLKDLPGYDTTAFFTRFGILRDFVDPDSPPTQLIPGLGDLACGMSLAMNIEAALIGREKTGKGERIESALNQVAAWMMLMPMLYAQYGISYQIKNDGPPVDVSNCNMRCGDGEYILLACGTIHQCHGLLRAVGMEHLTTDERCTSTLGFYKNTPTLYPEIAPVFLTRGAEEWVHILRAHDVPCERHRHTIEISSDEQLFANGYIYKPDYKNNDITVPVPPIDFASVDFTANEKGPAIGQHTAELLKALGYSQEQLEAMQNNGAIVMA